MNDIGLDFVSNYVTFQLDMFNTFLKNWLVVMRTTPGLSQKIVIGVWWEILKSFNGYINH